MKFDGEDLDILPVFFIVLLTHIVYHVHVCVRPYLCSYKPYNSTFSSWKKQKQEKILHIWDLHNGGSIPCWDAYKIIQNTKRSRESLWSRKAPFYKYYKSV